MKPYLKIGIALLSFGLLLALLGAGLMRSHSHHSKTKATVDAPNTQVEAKSAVVPPSALAPGK